MLNVSGRMYSRNRYFDCALSRSSQVGVVVFVLAYMLQNSGSFGYLDAGSVGLDLL
ncbi:hypothetical protein LCGC14_1543150 [marine sediment metagenome]|uniref:Uncharacterized protein n=1 Tax=marine sediment metagenome TaxID=412755 RepID=A0A0F9ISH6_9ZZZZ